MIWGVPPPFFRKPVSVEVAYVAFKWQEIGVHISYSEVHTWPALGKAPRNFRRWWRRLPGEPPWSFLGRALLHPIAWGSGSQQLDWWFHFLWKSDISAPWDTLRVSWAEAYLGDTIELSSLGHDFFSQTCTNCMLFDKVIQLATTWSWSPSCGRPAAPRSPRYHYLVLGGDQAAMAYGCIVSIFTKKIGRGASKNFSSTL